jgi:hypothetical protein
VTCRVTGAAAKAGTRVRLTHAGRTLATARLSGGRVVLRPSRKVRGGRYVVALASGARAAVRVR